MQNKTMKITKYMIAIVIIILLLLFIVPSKTLASQDVTKNFKDENLKNAIIEIIQKVTGDTTKQKITLEDLDAITSSDLPSGKQLNLANKNIQDLSGLELLADKKIEWIYLDWNNISDISVLSNFTSLTKISASENQITDLTPIRELSSLQNINFSNNKITDISSLANLKNLKYCYLENNNIVDITSLKSLNKLQEISIAGNSIQDISTLIPLENLKSLDCGRNNISKISDIQGNTKIEKINLNYNKLQSLSGIEKLSNLQILSASNNQIENIEGVEQLGKLYNLNLNKNLISNISVLSICNKLEYLYLDANKIISTRPIENLENLKKITMYNQVYTLVLDEDYGDKDIELTLTSLFTSLKDSQSKIYAESAICKTDSGVKFSMAENFSYIVVNYSDVKQQDLTFSIEDEQNTYVTLTIKAKIDEEPNLENTTYTLEDSYITGVNTKTPADQFLSEINANTSYIQRDEFIFTDSRNLCNGDILKFRDKPYTIIVKADPSGDGITTITDLMQVQNHVLGRTKLNTISFKAADLNKDNVINIVDVMNFVNIILRN